MKPFVSNLAGLEPPSHAVSQVDRHAAHRQHNQNQQQRRHEYHRLGGLDVRRLEPNVENVEPQMHELAIGVKERKLAVQGERRSELHYAGDHQRCDFAGSAGHRQDEPGHDARRRNGKQHADQRLELRGTQRQRTGTDTSRDGPQRFFRRHNHDGYREQTQREAGPQQTPRSEDHLVGVDQVRIEPPIEHAANAVHEEPQSENAVHDRGDARQVVDRNADGLDQRAFLGIFPEIHAGQDTQRETGDGHDEHQHDRAEDGREQSAFGIGLPRLVPEQLPDLGRIVPALGPESHVVRLPGTHDVGQRDGVGLVRRQLEDGIGLPQGCFDGPLFGGQFVRACLQFLFAGRLPRDRCIVGQPSPARPPPRSIACLRR